MSIHPNHVKTGQVNCVVITVSDTRNKYTDKSGRRIMLLLAEQDHTLIDYTITTDDYDLIKSTIKKYSQVNGIDAIILSGGTGIARRDVTYEAVRDLLHKELPGFGELFRLLSYQKDVGSKAMLSRAIAGVYNNKAIFALPGSTGAVTLAMNELILPELNHMKSELDKEG